jgi:GH43 family beta-xylosidase
MRANILIREPLQYFSPGERKLRRGKLAVLWAFWVLWTAASAFGVTFTNPIISDGADPWVVFKDGYYYLTDTTGGSIYVRSATKLTGTNGIGAAAMVKVFSPPAPSNKEVWAPELHFIQGKAYLYYAADNGTNENHRMFAAEQASPTSSFAYKGKVYDSTTDRWAIDGTVLEATNGSLYFIWSGWPGSVDGLQNLYIAPMSNPWTISGPRVLLSTPQLAWESWIQEGPEVLQRNGKVFVIYAANKSWTDNECLGMLVNSDGNYLNPASWTKLPQPVFQTISNATGAVYGPGHCSFTQSLDGTEYWLFFHAAQYRGAGWTRNIRMQRFTWAANGYPSFGQPVLAGVVLAGPSGDDFTPALLQPVSWQTNGWALVTARAPLPLLTNQWTVQSSGDLKNWSLLTNVPGTQYSAILLDGSAAPNRFYRVKSSR